MRPSERSLAYKINSRLAATTAASSHQMPPLRSDSKYMERSVLSLACSSSPVSPRAFLWGRAHARASLGALAQPKAVHQTHALCAFYLLPLPLQADEDVVAQALGLKEHTLAGLKARCAARQRLAAAQQRLPVHEAGVSARLTGCAPRSAELRTAGGAPAPAASRVACQRRRPGAWAAAAVAHARPRVSPAAEAAASR